MPVVFSRPYAWAPNYSRVLPQTYVDGNVFTVRRAINFNFAEGVEVEPDPANPESGNSIDVPIFSSPTDKSNFLFRADPDAEKTAWINAGTRNLQITCASLPLVDITSFSY